MLTHYLHYLISDLQDVHTLCTWYLAPCTPYKVFDLRGMDKQTP